MNKCSKCKKKADNPIGCEGTCGQWFHPVCVNLSDEEGKSKTIYFWCPTCRSNCVVTDRNNENDIKSIFDDIQQKITNLKNSIAERLLSSIKNDISNIISSSVSALKSKFNNIFPNASPTKSLLRPHHPRPLSPLLLANIFTSNLYSSSQRIPLNLLQLRNLTSLKQQILLLLISSSTLFVRQVRALL